MSLAYDEYLAEHIGNVNKGLQWMLDNLGLSQEEKSAIEDAMLHEHDASKYDTEEYEAYDKYFYGGNRSYKVVQDFNYAWLHHIHQNPHHWQYWVLLEDDPEEGLPCYKTLMIPLPYIFEMVADWWTFSWKNNNLFEIFNWYCEHREKQYIHPQSRKILERVLEKIWDVLIMQEAAAGHDIYEIEGQYKRFWIEQKTEQLSLEHSDEDDYLEHHGILGQRWGVRRYQNKDGTLTEKGRKRYGEEREKENEASKIPSRPNSNKENDNDYEPPKYSREELSKALKDIDKELKKLKADKTTDPEYIELVEMERDEIQEELDLIHSDISEDSDEGLFGIPELKKFPMPDKKHVKSAIRFFNYVDPKYEKELAEAILKKAEEFGLDLNEDITVGDENRFQKYLPKKEDSDD